MRRRGVGIAGLQKSAKAQEQFKETGNVISTAQLDQLKDQLIVFKNNLEDFASKYKKEISKNPVFRNHFQQMCSKIGVDPLQCISTLNLANKGFWAEILGVGDFYYELGVQVTEICISLREKTGGLVELIDLKKRIEKIRGRNSQEISQDDIIRSIKNLKPLGTGFDILTVGKIKMIQSVPREANMDHTALLTLGQTTGNFSLPIIISQLKWTETRANNAINGLISDGIVWIDDQVTPKLYWLPSLFSDI